MNSLKLLIQPINSSIPEIIAMKYSGVIISITKPFSASDVKYYTNPKMI
jgi:hypothetical protein